MTARAIVAQIFNLLHRRFATCGRFVAPGRAADCKSAMRQISNLRSCAALVLLPVLTAFGQLPAQMSATNTAGVRFQAVDIFVDSKAKPLAAYQLEFKATVGDVKIVGIEGGEHPAFAGAPSYDPKAIQHERVIIAAFSTANKLPMGKTRVATIHLQIGVTVTPEFKAGLQIAGDSNGNNFKAELTLNERNRK